MKVLHFLLLQIYGQKLASGGSATRSGVPEVISHDLVFEMQSATGECRGRRMLGAEYNSYGVTE